MNTKKNKKIRYVHLGLTDYQKVWDHQEQLFRSTIDVKLANRELTDDQTKTTPNYLIICEHPHVYTLGRSGDEHNLLLDENGLAKMGATYYKINRGGDITYHGPGQIVGYPILDLENFFTDIHKYLRLLEEAVIATLSEYSIESGRIKGLTGVWLDHIKQENPRKICALGVKSSRWVTMHGFAFNVNTDLDYFSHIVPCGISDKDVTSMKRELGHHIDQAQVEEVLLGHIVALFGMEIETKQQMDI